MQLIKSQRDKRIKRSKPKPFFSSNHIQQLTAGWGVLTGFTPHSRSGDQTLPAEQLWGKGAPWVWWASLRRRALPSPLWSWLTGCVWGDSRTSEAVCVRQRWSVCDCDSWCEPEPEESATGCCASRAGTGCGSGSVCAWGRRIQRSGAPPAPVRKLSHFLPSFTCCCWNEARMGKTQSQKGGGARAHIHTHDRHVQQHTDTYEHRQKELFSECTQGKRVHNNKCTQGRLAQNRR